MTAGGRRGEFSAAEPRTGTAIGPRWTASSLPCRSYRGSSCTPTSPRLVWRESVGVTGRLGSAAGLWGLFFSATTLADWDRMDAEDVCVGCVLAGAGWVASVALLVWFGLARLVYVVRTGRYDPNSQAEYKRRTELHGTGAPKLCLDRPSPPVGQVRKEFSSLHRYVPADRKRIHWAAARTRGRRPPTYLTVLPAADRWAGSRRRLTSLLTS